VIVMAKQYFCAIFGQAEKKLRFTCIFLINFWPQFLLLRLRESEIAPECFSL